MIQSHDRMKDNIAIAVACPLKARILIPEETSFTGSGHHKIHTRVEYIMLQHVKKKTASFGTVF
jgi:hypothetical protein